MRIVGHFDDEPLQAISCTDNQTYCVLHEYDKKLKKVI